MSQTNRAVPPTPDVVLRVRALIRMSLLTGVLLFGGVIWFLHRQPGYTAIDPARLSGLRLALPAAFALLLLAIVALRMVSREARGGRATPQPLIGWAFGEAAALLGGVWYYLTNDAMWYVGGLIVMGASFVLLPLRRE